MQPRGRRRQFDTDAALAAALRIFWKRGYEGASMAELTEAMGIAKPSLYSCFGDKQALFLKALDLYEREQLEYMRLALGAPTSKAVAEAFLLGTLEAHADRQWPPGCLLLTSTMPCGADGASVRAEAMTRRQASEAALLDRFARGGVAGDLPDGFAPDALARLLWAIAEGLCLQAANGAHHADLRRMVEAALAIWPSR